MKLEDTIITTAVWHRVKLEFDGAGNLILRIPKKFYNRPFVLRNAWLYKTYLGKYVYSDWTPFYKHGNRTIIIKSRKELSKGDIEYLLDAYISDSNKFEYDLFYDIFNKLSKGNVKTGND